MEEKFDGVGGLFESLLTTDLSVLTPQKLMELYNNASKIQQQRKQKQEEKNMRIRALEEKYKGIRVALGVPWVSLDIVNDFVNELLQLGGTIKNLVSYESTFGRWSVYKCMVLNSLNDYTYGTQRYSALRIIEATLNMREVIVKDGDFINEEETVAATQKQKLIIEKFNDWVWKSDDRKEKILSAYNQMFSDIKINTGDNINLEFKGKNDNVLLYDYQKSAIKRIVANKNTLLAFEVGTGKTYIMIASAMEMRAKGVSKKNMFVVPNNIVSQWKDMFLTLYPNATLLIVEPKVLLQSTEKKC